MKKNISHLLLLIFMSAFNFAPIKCLKELKVFYHDTQTEKGKDIYREFTQVGEDPWAKPDKFDIVLTVDNLKMSSKERIEILVEELYSPTSLNKAKKSLQDERWIPAKVVFSESGMSIKKWKRLKDGKITIKDISYASTGYYNSLLYNKLSFRVTAIYHDEETKKFERLEHEILIPE